VAVSYIFIKKLLQIWLMLYWPYCTTWLSYDTCLTNYIYMYLFSIVSVYYKTLFSLR